MGSIWKAVTGFFKSKQPMENLNEEEINDGSLDSDDEDFIPNEANEEAGSEEDSDGEPEDNDKDSSKSKKTERKPTKVSKRKGSKSTSLNGIKSKRGRFGESEDDNEKDTDFTSETCQRAEQNDDEIINKDTEEAREKAETDKLWADFLTSVDEEKQRKNNKDRTVEKVINKVYDFAGEKVSVQEKVKVTVASNSSNSNIDDNALNGCSNNDNDSEATVAVSCSSSTPDRTLDNEDELMSGPSSAITNGIKQKLGAKPRRRGGISILGNDPEAIGLDELEKRGLSGLLKAFQTKTKKIGTLEKSKLDWETYKRQQGLEDELETHNKSRDTYIDKQEFLNRTDHRQFEIEKNMRATARSRRLVN